MARGRDRIPNESSSDRSAAAKRELANQERLMALGDAVAQRSGVTRKPRKIHQHRLRRNLIIAGVSLIALVVVIAGGGYLYANWQFSKITKIKVTNEPTAYAGQPFNILVVGSDSRVGLTGVVARQTGATTGSVSGQRSDVVKVVHVDPIAGTIATVSIPRDTMVTLLAYQSLYGQFNRINVNLRKDPSLLAQTITANFGIPINYTIVVSFAGLINAADALGGVYLNFPYQSWDPYSQLKILHPGCQLITGVQALDLSRSRHFYYNVKGTTTFPTAKTSYTTLMSTGWAYDGTSDFGRIDRQNAFLRAMVNRAKGIYNPLTITSFLSKLPQGIALDQKFTLNDLIKLAVRFHNLSANAIQTWTLPNYSALSPVGSVLFVQEPQTQQLLVNIFGKGLVAPTNPPPNPSLQTPAPPHVTPTTTTTTTAPSTKKKKTTTTTIPNPTLSVPSFDPVPCTP
jgi:LCP family protein required for cell wall assembly